MRVDWSGSARKDLKGLDHRVAKRIIDAVDRYAASGDGDVKRLRGSAEHRLRVGDWRVRFDLLGGQIHVMLVIRVLHRREAYR